MININKTLIIATGSNIGDKAANLNLAKTELSKHFRFIAESRIYCSDAYDYTDQPAFYNQVLQFELQSVLNYDYLIDKILLIEKELGRKRDIPKGPRIIDIDILFVDNDKFENEKLCIPHPRLFERSFVVLPLKELPYFQQLKNHFEFKRKFSIPAFPL